MIKDNIARVKTRIGAACARINADPAGIRIVCVSKGRPVESIREAVEAGLTCLGENRVQEAREKYGQVPGAEWQMIGHLQTNKVKDAVNIFSLIHSVDSVGLAQEIDRRARNIGKLQDILIEVKTSPEATKYGVEPGVLAGMCKEVARLDNLKVKGLMTIAPLTAKAEDARKYFSRLRQLRDGLDPSWLLSMGMSDDFEVAIEEGADMVRLGRVIFA
jgi:pyridoxal phosphate enzyme (YggS family)